MRNKIWLWQVLWGLQADKDLYNKVVKGDIAEFNEFMKQQNSYDI